MAAEGVQSLLFLASQIQKKAFHIIFAYFLYSVFDKSIIEAEFFK